MKPSRGVDGRNPVIVQQVIECILFQVWTEQSRQADDTALREKRCRPDFKFIAVPAIGMVQIRLDCRVLIAASRFTSSDLPDAAVG